MQAARSNPRAYGEPHSTWTLVLLKEIILKNIQVSQATVWRTLRRAGIRFKCAVHRCWSPDPKYLNKVALIEERRQKAQVCSDENVFLYEDECHLGRRPTLSKCYFPKGSKPPQVGKGTSESTRCIFGAVNAVYGKILYLISLTGASTSFITFLEQVEQTYWWAKRITIVLDNWGVHFSNSVEDWLKKHSRIELLPLPTYAPWLNPMERLWRWMRRCVTHNHPWTEIQEVIQGAQDFLEDVKDQREQVFTSLGLKPVLIKPG